MVMSSGEKKTPGIIPQSAEGLDFVTPSAGGAAGKAYRSAAVASADRESAILDISHDSIGSSEAPEQGSRSQREDRDAMVMESLDLVKYIAHRIANRVPAHVDVDDLINSGIIGLIDAAERFEPGRNVKFRTYAEQRVRGAILDSLRDLDWVPRALRRKKKDIEEAYHALEQQFGRAASDEEVAERLGVNLEDLHKSIDELKGVTLGSFEDASGEGEGLISFIPDPDAEDPHMTLHESEIRQILKKAIGGLPAKEQKVVQFYYFAELNMKEIGDILNITESRVSQLHTKAMLRLRGKLRNYQVNGR